MKSTILGILRTHDGVVSGEKLSAELGISRVSVWKHIQKLVECGYKIESASKGYTLENSPDALYSWEFPDREKLVHYYEEVGSTMDVARDLARKGCPDFTVAVAGEQTKGRGRLKRTWFSTRGGLYFTVVTRPGVPPATSSKVNFAASLALVLTLRGKYGIDARVKWPNDILVEEKKIMGMLSEMEAESDLVSFINIGIGLNVNNDPTADEPNSISMRRILGKNTQRKEVLSAFLDEFEDRLKSGLDGAVSEWKKHSITLNRHVKVVTTREVTEGFARDIDENGALLLELADGTLKKVIYGDCFHNPSA